MQIIAPKPPPCLHSVPPSPRRGADPLIESRLIIAFDKLSPHSLFFCARAACQRDLAHAASRRTRWHVTDAGDILGAGRSWQVAASSPLCLATGLIMAALLPPPAGVFLQPPPALIHSCRTSLPLSPSPALVSPPLLALSSTRSNLLSTRCSSSACSAGSEASGSFSISVFKAARSLCRR